MEVWVMAVSNLGCRPPAPGRQDARDQNWNYMVTSRLSSATSTPTRGHVSELRVMAVHAHPDDESSKGAATLARYADEGHRVLVVTLTGGERGEILNPAMDLPDVHGHIAEIRRDEMAKAAEILGVEHTWLGFVDAGLPQGDPPPPLPDDCFALVPLEVSIEALVRAIREFRPHVMTTYDENGGYPHPDHIRCHQVSVGAYEAAADYARFPDA